MPSPPLLLDDDLRQVFEFIPRPVLARSQSLVTKNFNELAHSKMHICHKHLVRNMIVFGRQLRDGEWRECCLALGDMIKYEPFFLPLDPDVPDNIVGIRELVVGHFSGDQLIHFLTDCIGQLLQGCRLEIRFVESLLECEDTERAELDQFMHHFHRMCSVLCIFSYERQFLMPQFLFEADILAKLRVVHLNDSIPPEHLHFLLDWLHLPSLAVGGLEVEESSRPEKKLKFRSGDRTFLDQLVTEIRLRFKTPSSSPAVQFKVVFAFSSQTPANQFEPNWNFIERDETRKEILTSRSLFYPKMFELRRQKANEEELEEGPSHSRRQVGHGNGQNVCNMVINVFRPAD